MHAIYEWLYDHYAQPRLERLPEFEQKALEQLAEKAPQMSRLRLTDSMLSLRLDWCTAAFSLGVRVGIALQADNGESLNGE